MKSADVLGQALKDFYHQKPFENLTVISDITDEDVIPLAYLFRNHHEMPLIEQQALEWCKGNVLDVGAASGCHSLYLQENGVQVTAIDVSDGAVEVMKNRGVVHAKLQDFFTLQNERFDTILLLMNGVGIAQNLQKMPEFLTQCKQLLAPGGQVLLDSSDIQYLFEEEDGSMWINTQKAYYGEVSYQLKYKTTVGEPFDWIFLDFDTLAKEAEKVGLIATKVMEGEHFDYLARLCIEG